MWTKYGKIVLGDQAQIHIKSALATWHAMVSFVVIKRCCIDGYAEFVRVVACINGIAHNGGDRHPVDGGYTTFACDLRRLWHLG